MEVFLRYLGETENKKQLSGVDLINGNFLSQVKCYANDRNGNCKTNKKRNKRRDRRDKNKLGIKPSVALILVNDSA